MKECPECKRNYDDSLNFCLEDGKPLSVANDPEATLVLPRPEENSATANEVAQKYQKLIKDIQVFFLSDIPRDKLSSAYTAYAQQALLGNENPLCLYDDGRNGGHGCLLTDRALYYQSSFSAPGHLALRNLKSVVVKGVGPWKKLQVNESIDIGWTLGSRESLQLVALMLLELMKSSAVAN